MTNARKLKLILVAVVELNAKMHGGLERVMFEIDQALDNMRLEDCDDDTLPS